MITAGVPWYQPPVRSFSSPSTMLRDVADRDRRAVAVGDDDRLVGLRRRDLVVGGDGVGLLRAVERALRSGDVGAGDRGAQILHRDAVGGEPRQIGLHPHRRLQAAQHGDAADARKSG